MFPKTIHGAGDCFVSNPGFPEYLIHKDLLWRKMQNLRYLLPNLGEFLRRRTTSFCDFIENSRWSQTAQGQGYHHRCGLGTNVLGPAVQAIMSSRVPSNAQGELQGGLGSIVSLAAIVSPPVMTGVFGYFTQADASVYYPGASYLLAGLLVLVSFVMFLPHLRPKVN